MIKPLFMCLMASFAWSVSAKAQDSEPTDEMFDENVFTIEGEIQRPDINIFIVKKNLDKAYELKLRESFIPKIKESMKKRPF